MPASSFPDRTDFLAKVFDALPAPALVVDPDVRMIDFNLEAARLIERVPFAILDPPAGQALACIHAAESPAGCGHAEACPDCPIRNSVREAFATGQVCRRIARIELARGGRNAAVDLLVSVAPIAGEAEPLALLVLDDAAELAKLFAGGKSAPAAGRRQRKPRRAAAGGF